MPDIIADTADIDDQIAVSEGKPSPADRGAPYSGAADDDLVRNVLPIRKRGLNL
jgi:hypothetical protein